MRLCGQGRLGRMCPPQSLRMVQGPVFISLEMSVSLRDGMGFHIVWVFLVWLILSSPPSALLGISPKAGHVGGTSHSECFLYKMRMAVYWYWEVVRKSSELWPLLLAVVDSQQSASVFLPAESPNWEGSASLRSTILAGNTVCTPASNCYLGVHSAECGLESRTIWILSELGNLSPQSGRQVMALFFCFCFSCLFDTNWNLLGEGPRLRSCLLQVGLWASLWVMFLIND